MGRNGASRTASTSLPDVSRVSKRRQDGELNDSVTRESYHHGDLRAALIQAADQIIAQKGIEGFSLRAAAKRAGVSPAAPAHHFGSAKGLLTEVAILAYERAGRSIESAGHTEDIVTNVRTMTLTFIKFVLENPGHFRLMFRNDLVDRSDPRLNAASKGPGNRLAHAILAYRTGKTMPAPANFKDSAAMLCGMATLHGLGTLILEEKAAHFFAGATAVNFTKEYLPQVVEYLYPQPSLLDQDSVQTGRVAI